MKQLVAIVMFLCGLAPSARATPEEDAAWKVFRPAMLAFQAGGARADFLKTSRALLAAHPHTIYTAELTSLVSAIELDDKRTAPTLSASASPDDVARFWIFQLRELAGRQFSDPGYPMLFDLGGTPTAADQLVALGPAAIPRVIEALDDDTPTRTIAWQRSYYPVYFVLRRKDVAMKVLERITGCRFYDEGATFIHLYMDKPERRQAALADVKAWWKRSAGASQAQLIHNQLELMSANASLSPASRLSMLWILGELEGPEAVVPELRRLYDTDTYGLNSPVVEVLDDLDPQTPARGALARFWADKSRDGDYVTLLEYGDARVYAEIARRFVATGKLDPGAWNLGDQARAAARSGKLWAIPILAHMLANVEMTGSRLLGAGGQPFSDADIAIEELAPLVGRDFGYLTAGSVAERLAAIAKAREWWEHGGEAEMKPRIAQAHAVLAGDRLRTDAELAATAHAIDNAATRGKTLAALGVSSSFVVQRALVRALAATKSEADRRAILAALQPAVWQLPAIADVVAKPGDAKTRVLAAERITAALTKHKQQIIWWNRIETRDSALATVRIAAHDATAPIDVQKAAARVLAEWGAPP